jgi:hypothetical protein
MGAAVRCPFRWGQAITRFTAGTEKGAGMPLVPNCTEMHRNSHLIFVCVNHENSGFTGKIGVDAPKTGGKGVNGKIARVFTLSPTRPSDGTGDLRVIYRAKAALRFGARGAVLKSWEEENHDS